MVFFSFFFFFFMSVFFLFRSAIVWELFFHQICFVFFVYLFFSRSSLHSVCAMFWMTVYLEFLYGIFLSAIVHSCHHLPSSSSQSQCTFFHISRKKQSHFFLFFYKHLHLCRCCFSFTHLLFAGIFIHHSLDFRLFFFSSISFLLLRVYGFCWCWFFSRAYY